MFILMRQMIDEAARNGGQAYMRTVLMDEAASYSVQGGFSLDNAPERLHLQILDGCIYMYADGGTTVLDIDDFERLNTIFSKSMCQVVMQN